MILHLLKLVWNRKRSNALIIAEIFISFLVIFVVLTGAITVLSNWNLPLGFVWKDVWNVSMNFDIDRGQETPAELRNSVMRMLDEARSFPQVAAVAISNSPPYAFSTSNGSRMIEGKEVDMIFDNVTDDFAEVMRMKVVRGRWFNSTDDASQNWPIVVDENTARAIWGDADPIGRKIEEDERMFLQVVGVVEGYRKDGEPSTPVNMVFLRTAPDGKYGRLGRNMVVRVHPGTPSELEEQLAERLQKVVPGMSLRMRNMERMRTNMLRTRMIPLVAGGIVGLFLIAMVGLGLTGVLWQNVTRRTREIGLRRAVGASGPMVHRQVLLEVLLLATIAMMIGAIVVLQLPILGITSVVSTAAFTSGFAGALATIYALTVLCALYPSWLASRLSPSEALRYE